MPRESLRWKFTACEKCAWSFASAHRIRRDRRRRHLHPRQFVSRAPAHDRLGRRVRRTALGHHVPDRHGRQGAELLDDVAAAFLGLWGLTRIGKFWRWSGGNISKISFGK